MENFEHHVATSVRVRWVSATGIEVPPGANPVGLEECKNVIFVARVVVAGIALPDKLLPGFQGAIAAWGVLEFIHRRYEVLCVVADNEELPEAD